MRELKRAGEFKRDYKRERKGQHQTTLATDLGAVLELLAEDMPLPSRYRDHSLGGIWAGYRECHIKPDLLLIYKKSEDGVLHLVRLGSHSELF